MKTAHVDFEAFSSLAFLKRALSHLLCWAVHPHEDALSESWLQKTKEDVSAAINIAYERHQADSEITLRLKAALPDRSERPETRNEETQQAT